MKTALAKNSFNAISRWGDYYFESRFATNVSNSVIVRKFGRYIIRAFVISRAYAPENRESAKLR